MKHMGGPPLTSVAQTREWYFSRFEGEGRGCVYLIELLPHAQAAFGVGGDQGEPAEGAAPKRVEAGVRDDKGRLIVGTTGSKGLPHLGYGIHPAFWGRGLATESVGAFVGAYFASLPRFVSAAEDGGDQGPLARAGDGQMRRRLREFGEGRNWVQADVVEENVGSWKVLEKVGFRREGRERRELGGRRAEWVVEYRLRREQWEGGKWS
ncbi:MAG: hypothetical protein LQ340_008084 [Diploschistes diacapsis]|nr:MAG: hypothetical protein LQ340_008084 [Diploschistes diacapsis]